MRRVGKGLVLHVTQLRRLGPKRPENPPRATWWVLGADRRNGALSPKHLTSMISRNSPNNPLRRALGFCPFHRARNEWAKRFRLTSEEGCTACKCYCLGSTLAA